MGCFTQYCCICGGPGQNYYGHYNDEDDKPVFENDKNTIWLDKVQVICEKYITKNGEYDSYGNVDVKDDDKIYSVTPSVWNYFDDFIPGLLVHSICLSMLRKYIRNFNNKNFFIVFKNYVGDYGIFNNIDYYGIEKYLGQDYKVNRGEEYLIENPYIIKKEM